MLLTILGMVIIISILIGFNALYVAGEFAAVSARKTRIEQQANTGNALATRLIPVIDDHHKLDNYIAASQVGITISSIMVGIYGQQQIAPLLAPLLQTAPFIQQAAAAGIAATLVLLLLTTVQVILGELVPKSLALQYPEKVALATVLPMRLSADIILKPLIVVLNGSGVLIMKLLGIQHEGGHKHVHAPEEIRLLINQSHKGGLIEADEHDMLGNAFRYTELTAGEILMPRTRMVAVSVDTPLDEVLRVASEGDFTRIPVYEEDIDHIVGFAHLKEVFQLSYAKSDATVKSIMRDVVYVPESIHLHDVWQELDRKSCYLAIVLDEYSGTAGMVTREDLLEELFGEVDDEFDATATPIVRRIKPGEYRVRGDAAITVVNDRLELDLPHTRTTSIGGLMTENLGKLPSVGDEVEIDGVVLSVTRVRDKVVAEARLFIPKRKDAS